MPTSYNTDVLVCTDYIQAAKVETREWIAPILRESKRYEGLKISVDSLTFGNYLSTLIESK